MKRRDFLKTSAILTTSSLLPISLKASNAKLIGLQLYTVRKEIENNLVGTLKQVAEIGYNAVELANYSNGKFYGLNPKEFKKITDDLGLKILSTHNALNPENVQKSIEDCKTLGIEYVVLPFLMPNLRKSIDDYKKLCDQFNDYGGACAKAGMKFAYHNHDFEFKIIDDQIPYNILLEGTDEKVVSFEMDLYWIKKAGYDPLLDYFTNYPGRFKLWHVKDMDAKSGNYTEVGAGNTDFKSIFNNASKSGMQYFFVELDNSQRPALESIKISYDCLNKADYVR
jgi:sugar phosphate isomerase/epimerase